MPTVSLTLFLSTLDSFRRRELEAEAVPQEIMPEFTPVEGMPAGILYHLNTAPIARSIAA